MAPWQATCVNCSGDYQITCNSPAVTWSTSDHTTAAKSDQINVRSTASPYITISAYNNTMQDKLKYNLNSMGIDV
jgi:hypothetical protein